VAFDRQRRYRSRRAFAAAVGVGPRTIDKLETGREHNYRAETKSRVEAALFWTPGSIDRIVAGGRPTYEVDPLLAELTRMWPDLSRDARVMLLRLARDALTS
jgi:transcriptional regulator with XRE-family HTH domain